MQKLHIGNALSNVVRANRLSISGSHDETETQEPIRGANMAYMNQTTARHSTVLARVSAFFDGIATRYQQRRMYRETFDGLNALTDRELLDLGLHRSELARVAKEAVNR
jgi:uncharacterized protein YjiS (DUF1127 family)